MTAQTVQGPEPRIEETYGKLAGLAMLLFSLFGCLVGLGLGAGLILWLKP
jgi:hypothetical protein